jgi:hypothetical protein
MIDSYQQLSVKSRGWKEFPESWADMEQEMTGQLQHALEKQMLRLKQDYLASSYHERTARRADYRNDCYRRKQVVTPMGTRNGEFCPGLDQSRNPADRSAGHLHRSGLRRDGTTNAQA